MTRWLALALASLAALLVGLAFLSTADAYPDGVTPPEGCECHSETPSPDLKIVVEGWPEEYVPDSTYTLRITSLGAASGSSGGFAAEVSKGTFQSDDPLVAVNGKYATHNAADRREWRLEWRTPPEDSGNTTLTVFVNAANGDGTENEQDVWNEVILAVPEKAPEPPKPSFISLSFFAENGTLVAGENVTIAATLTNFSGASIPRATVTFIQNTTYGTLLIGQNTTGLDGRAILNWTVVAECDCRFFAHYDGSSKNLSANVTTPVKIFDASGLFATLYPTPSQSVFDSYWGVRAPLGIVVLGVWGTLGYAALAALRVRAIGAPADDGPRGLLRLLTSRGGR